MQHNFQHTPEQSDQNQKNAKFEKRKRWFKRLLSVLKWTYALAKFLSYFADLFGLGKD